MRVAFLLSFNKFGSAVKEKKFFKKLMMYERTYARRASDD